MNKWAKKETCTKYVRTLNDISYENKTNKGLACIVHLAYLYYCKIEVYISKNV